MNPTTAERERFEALYRTYAHRVHGYVRRHVDAGQVEEVVAETFLIAWRRRDLVPSPDPVPWLLVTARRVAANNRRHGARGELAHDRLETLMAAAAAVDGPVVERAVAITALAGLTAAEREAVLLVAWDGLATASAAAVAGCSVRAFTVRLHRARQRLARSFDHRSDPPVAAGHITRPTSPEQEQS